MRKELEKDSKPARNSSIIEKVNKYLEKFGMLFNGKNFEVSVDVGEGDFITITDTDYEYLDILESTLVTMVDAAQKAKNQTGFLAFCRFYGSRSPEAARYISHFTDLIMSENIAAVEAGDWLPVFSINGKQGSLSNEYYTEDWLRRAKKTLLLEPTVRPLKSLYFGRGFVNSGTVDYTADYLAARNSGRSNNVPSR